MSPLFHKTDDGGGRQERKGALPSLAQLGPQLDEVVTNTSALPVEQLAAQLMTKYFTTSYLLASQITDLVSVDTISWDLLPDNSGEHLGEPIPDAFFALQDVVTEALQLLRTAGLVMERSYLVGQDHGNRQWLDGLVTTRRGRAALTDGSVGRILDRLVSPPT